MPIFANSQETHQFYHENHSSDTHTSVQQPSHIHQELSYVNPPAQLSSNHMANLENFVTMQPAAPKLVSSPPTLHETKQSSIIQEVRMSDPASGNISQTGYDQWYNQNAGARAPPPPSQQQTPWYSNVNRNLHQKQWTSTDSSADSYETIQPPNEFISTDVTSSESSSLYERDNREMRESTSKDNVSGESKPSTPPRDLSIVKNSEQPTALQQVDLPTDNYEFASNDRNTFLETGELTDSHHEQALIPTSQEDENDDVPGDIPFLREVPGQSSYTDPRRNDPTGQEQYVQSSPRLVDPRRNDLSGQAQGIQARSLSLNDRSERRDVPSGEERRESLPVLSRDAETLERRNDPSGRERSLPPPAQSRNDPSGEERIQSQSQIPIESNELRQVPGSGVNSTEPSPPVDVAAIRQIPGGLSPIDVTNMPDNINNNTRVVTGSQETPLANVMRDLASETRNKREEAVGASMREDDIPASSSPKRRDSYEDGDDEESANSRDENRERRREPSPNDKRRYDYDRKGDRSYYEREREYDDEYYYDRRRGPDFERTYNSREDLDRRETSFREGDRRHSSRDDLDERRGGPGRLKEEDERELRRRDERRGVNRIEDPRRRDGRDYDPRYPRDPRDREYNADRERRREERRRRYDEYDPRDPRREYYDDPYVRNSRPSSRSSYNDRERDYYMRSRDPYYGYNGYGSYDYGANYNANYYAYLENLRRTNPTAYMEWYHKYYASQHQQQQQSVAHVANYPEDRASVHSGRSSCEDRSTSVKQSIGDISLIEDSRVQSRMTPTKFSSSHVQGSFSIGSLVHVHASYPADGERARVDIFRVDSLLHHDPVTRELRLYPGPLVKGVTHKKTIIEYCETKIKKATINDELVDRASYILLYQLMIMLIQQNGNVVGVDIAALLLRNKKAYPYDVNKGLHEPTRRASTISQRSVGTVRDEIIHDNGSQHETEDVKPQKSIEQITNEFRNTLLDGLVQQALEYAMNEGLWGHALFLASKLDKRTHASVMTRFANSLPVQDSLQTLYQLHSGRVPASMTCVADSKWDDWRPHLAMVISNTSANPDINRRSIITMGDTLATRGDIYAAHFCYILAEIEFGVYGTAGTKLVLVGGNHHKSYMEFATSEAVMLTEIYEYARNLSEPGCTLVGLQTFKFKIAQKMVDCGLIEKALLYLEQISINIVNGPANYEQSFINDVYTLSERIKYHDPVFKDCIEDNTTLVWLNDLAEVVGRYQTGEIVQNNGNSGPVETQQPYHEPEQYTIQWSQQQQQQQQQQLQSQWSYTGNQNYNAGPVSMMEVPTNDATQDQWQPLSLPANVQESNIEQTGQYAAQTADQYQQSQQQQEYWGQQQYNQQDYTANDYHTADWQQQQQQSTPYQHEQTDIIDSSQQQATWNYEGPVMYNPIDLKQNSTKNTSRGRYPPR
ncbi:hypothetical protein PV327_005493 [Microctonus hyperodae]|uniref:Sec16 Sec23-binding domain-containing protein n=1 Tax=Microctonus hyperodae TaxID=165561 RepID=A0AA39G1S8_MICHY|nr:hypothetical protein PV327_005493 [Microctonus hyperodae]